jgi:hypothetical protein
VYHALRARGADVLFAFYRDAQTATTQERVAARESLPHEFVQTRADAITRYRAFSPAWVVFGNGFDALGQLPSGTKSALLYHGIGVKDCYYDADLAQMDVRFVEGRHRAEEIRRRTPSARVHVAGFAKLDPLFAARERGRPRTPPSHFGLGDGRPTLLYAPTFFPSSIELMADDWPRAFEDFNLLVKPHFFSLRHARYRAQREKIARWRKFDNVYIAGEDDYTLLPFLDCADMLISEASSALFEFAALDRPVVWCDFLKLRWSYRGPFRYRLERRMDRTILKYADIGAHVRAYSELLPTVRAQLRDAARFEPQRRRYTEELLGQTDGHASDRIADYLFANSTA